MNQDEVTKLNLVSRELQRKDDLARLNKLERQQPYSRQDGGTAARPSPVDAVRNAMQDARRIIDGLEKEVIRLESSIAELEARLNGERDRGTKLETMLQEISTLVAAR